MAVFTIGSKTLSGSPTGGAVGGASNLTTVGAIPYVSASGVLNQDATALFWDATNHRLGVGTASPVSGYTQTIVAPDNSATTALYLLSNNLTQNLRLGWNGIFGSAAIDITTNGGIAAARFNTTGNLLIGGTTDGNYKLDVQKSGNTGTLRVYDQTAVTGSTLAVIQAGAGQSGNLLSVRNNAGVEVTKIDQYGDIGIQTTSSGGVSIGTVVGGVTLGSANLFGFTASSSGGTRDLSLSRASAGVLQVGDGGANALGTVAAKQFAVSAATRFIFDSGGSTVSMGNAYGTLKFIGAGEVPMGSLTSTGTLTIYNETATTGSTKAVVRAGAGQSGNLQEWQNNAGSALAAIDSSGNVIPNSLVVGTTAITSTGLAQGSARVLTWSSTTNYFGTADLGLARNAAGVLEIDSGTAGQYRDLLLRRSQHSGVAVSALPAAAAGNAGSIQYVTDANATTIGSTVAGGGSNKVMVWSDGTNWKIFAS